MYTASLITITELSLKLYVITYIQNFFCSSQCYWNSAFLITGRGVPDRKEKEEKKIKAHSTTNELLGRRFAQYTELTCKPVFVKR